MMPREDGMDVSLVSRDFFPMLQRVHERRQVVYLDAAASTPSPHAVLTRERYSRAELGGSAPHSRHLFAEEARLAYDSARASVARFVNAAARSLVFVGSISESVSLIVRGLSLERHAVVLTTRGERQALLAPWSRQADVRYLPNATHLALDPVEVARELREQRPKVFVFHHASSISGVVQPAAELCARARELGIVSVVDAAQSAPYLPLDVEQLGCDFLLLSAHRLLGPQGIGALYVRPGLVENLEAESTNIHGAVGFEAAVSFIEATGRERIAAHGRELARLMRDRLERLPLRHVLLAAEGERIPVASLVLRPGGLDAEQLASTLSQSFGVMVGSGLHQLHPLQAEADQNTIRASAYLYNDAADIHTFADSCERVLKRLGS
jgi:cysteine desulfurase / selenocysteine lyase